MASNLVAMSSNLIAMVSNLGVMASNKIYNTLAPPPSLALPCLNDALPALHVFDSIGCHYKVQSQVILSLPLVSLVQLIGGACSS